MCGRYALYGPQSRYREHFSVDEEFDAAPRFNVAPSAVMPVLRQSGEGRRSFVAARWGLIPSWAKDVAGMAKPINAKAETAAVKPMFRHAFRQGRVLVPADAFYEWQAVQGGKQPYLFRMRDGAPFGMAGLLEHWRGPDGEQATFVILTTAANDLVARMHDRMPAIVRPDDYGRWLDSRIVEAAALQGILAPYPDQLMAAYRVSRRVNSPANDGPELVEPLPE
jgi:putative SOS response-associated peptidase YedK